MNLLIIFVILTVLMISDAGNSQPVENVWFRGFAILATLGTVPAFAAFQTVLVTRKLRSEDYAEDKIQNMLNRLTVCHSGVWLVSSLCVVYLLQWQQIVRGNWQLDRFPLLDEAMIIAPIILSLIGSWFLSFSIFKTLFCLINAKCGSASDSITFRCECESTCWSDLFRSFSLSPPGIA